MPCQGLPDVVGEPDGISATTDRVGCIVDGCRVFPSGPVELEGVVIVGYVTTVAGACQTRHVEVGDVNGVVCRGVGGVMTEIFPARPSARECTPNLSDVGEHSGVVIGRVGDIAVTLADFIDLGGVVGGGVVTGHCSDRPVDVG